MSQNKKNSKIINYIIIFTDYLLEEDYPISVLEELDERFGFLLKELDFWISRGSLKRYEESLLSFLSWAYDQVSPRFYQNGNI